MFDTSTADETGFEMDIEEDAVTEDLDEDLWLERNRLSDPSIVELPSGLQYRVITEASSDAKVIGRYSTSKFHYRGSLVDGTEFDSSYSRGEPLLARPGTMIAGWTEALLLMREGDKWELFIPSKLAYGDKGAGSVIPGGATLRFEMEIIEVDPEMPFLEVVKDIMMNPIPGFFLKIPVWQIMMFVVYIGVRIFMARGSFMGGDKCEARHILVKEESLAAKIKKTIKSDTFGAAAKEHSTCPSKSKGGSLGSFSPGSMVKEFDTVCFDPKVPLGVVQGPIKTQFGYHLIIVDKRTGSKFEEEKKDK